MGNSTRKRVGALLAAVLLSLALSTVFAVAALAVPPLAEHAEGISGNPPTYRTTGVRPDSGPMGDRLVAIAGRGLIPATDATGTGATSTTWVVFGVLAAVVLVITGATVLADRRLGRERVAAARAAVPAPTRLPTTEAPPEERRKAA